MNPLELLWEALHRVEKAASFSFKEVSLIKSQNISIALIFLYPVLAITALALALGGVSPMDVSFGKSGLENVPIGLVLAGDNDFFDSAAFGAELAGFEYLDISEYYSRWELRDAIKKGEVVVGAIITPPESETDFIEAEFLYDDSSLFAAGTILAQAKTAINSMGFKKSSEMLTELIENLDAITSNLAAQAEKTDGIIQSLESTDQKLLDLNASINSIDTNEILSRLSLFDQYYVQSKQDINATLQDIAEMKGMLAEYRGEAEFARSEIRGVLGPAGQDLNSLKGIADSADEPEKSALLGLHAQLEGYFLQIDGALFALDKVISDINGAENKLRSAESKLLLADGRLDLAKREIEAFSENFSKIGLLIGQAKELVAATQESKSSVLAELQGAKRTFNSLISALERLGEFSPEDIVSPIKISIEPVYGISKVESMVPVSVALILLLTALLLASTSIIIERERGVYFRLMSSPTSYASWISGKIAGQMVFALLEALIILVIAALAFGVQLPHGMLELAIAIAGVSFAFICMGLFIPEIMRTQATAILSSLLILLPMLFLSGLIFPIEFMPSPVDVIASVLPLTVAINILSAMMLKGALLGELAGEFALLLVPALGLLAVTLWRNRGTGG